MILAFFLCANQLELTLEEAIKIALSSNIELQQEYIDLKSAQSAKKAAMWDLTPNGYIGITSEKTLSAGLSQSLPTGADLSLDWSEAEYNTIIQDQLSLSLSQPILAGADPAYALSKQKSARLYYSKTELEYKAAIESLLLSISNAYWSLLAANETLGLAEKSLEIAEEQLKDTIERREEGFAALGDVLQVQRLAGVAKQAVVVAGSNVSGAQDRFTRLLGVNRDITLILLDRPTEQKQLVDYNESLKSALENNSSWLMSEISLKTAEQDLRVAISGSLPDLSGYGALDLFGNAENPTQARNQLFNSKPAFEAGLNLSGNLGFTGHHERVQAKLSLERANLKHIATKQDLERNIASAVRAVIRDQQRVELAILTVEAANAALEADQELLRDGRGSTRDVVRSLESLDEANVSRLQAEIDLQNSILELARQEGSLLNKFGL